MGKDDSEEKIEVESIRDLTDTEQVEAIAAKFAEISNLYDCLDRSQIDIPHFTPDQFPVDYRFCTKKAFFSTKRVPPVFHVFAPKLFFFRTKFVFFPHQNNFFRTKSFL